MKIKVNNPIINLDGHIIKDEEKKEITVGKTLANMVLASKSDALRAYILAQDIYKAKEDYDLKDSDKPFVIEAIEESQYTVLVKGQILQVLKK